MRAQLDDLEKAPVFIVLAVLLLWAGGFRDCWAGIDAGTAGMCETTSHATAFREDNPRYYPDFAVAIKEENWALVRGYLLWHIVLPDGLTARQKARIKRERISAELIPASARGDRAAVMRLLRLGADPNARADTDDFAFPLAWAARCDHTEVVQILLARGAHVDARFSYGAAMGMITNSTALMWAADSGARKSVAILLAHRADPRVQSRWHFPPDAAGVPSSTALDNAGDQEIRKMLRKALKDRASKAKKDP